LRAEDPDLLRAELLVCRVRVAVPPRGRAAPLGARVAMIPTVTSTGSMAAERSRRVAKFPETLVISDPAV
jgi:hypothetical protein